MKLKLSHTHKQKIYKQVDDGEISLPMTLKQLRRSIAKTQDEYAQLVNVTSRTLQEFEQGKGNPTLETLNKLFHPFGLEISLRRIRKPHHNQ